MTPTPAHNRPSLIDRSRELLPWRRALEFKRCFLYWAPVDRFPLPEHQKDWWNLFLDRFTDLLQKQLGLRAEVFMQIKVIYPDLVDQFLDVARELTPVMGLSRRPGVPPPPIPTLESLQPIADGTKIFDYRDYMADYCYWFLNKPNKRGRDLFFGNAGMTVLFLKPDPQTVPPKLPIPPAIRTAPQFKELFEQIDLDRLTSKAFALRDGFQKKSVGLFRGGLETNVQFRGVPFIIPLLGTSNFFAEPAEVCESWFQLFDVYVNESPDDRGIVMATQADLEEEICALLTEMKQNGVVYLEGK
jgi:hypothetical protein